MFDLEKLTRRWLDSDSWWLCILISARTASSTDDSCSSAILRSFLYEQGVKSLVIDPVKSFNMRYYLREKFECFNFEAV